MPWLDMSPVLANPFFADDFTVIRRMQVVDDKGVASEIIMGVFPAGGIVVPTGDNSLTRQDAFEAQANAIQVITAFRLRGATKDAAGTNWLPDLVQWNGDYFIVKELNEFSNMGAGFLAVDCVSFDYNPKPVAEQTTPPTLDQSQAANSGQRLKGWL